MKRTHLIAVLVAIAAMGIFAADASAMYHPTMGRFLQRDPGPGGVVAARRVGSAGKVVGESFIARDPIGHRSNYMTGPMRASFQDSRFVPVFQATSTDAFGQYVDGMNLYEYVSSNPLAYVDPSGLFKSYECCTAQQKQKVKADEVRAKQQIAGLKARINQAIANDKGQYPWFTAQKMRTALRRLNKSADVIQKYKAKCEKPGDSHMCKKASAWVKWVFAQTVHLCPSNPGGQYLGYFNLGPNNRAATLVHEGTHVDGTLDAIYFPNQKPPERPHDHWVG